FSLNQFTPPVHHCLDYHTSAGSMALIMLSRTFLALVLGSSILQSALALELRAVSEAAEDGKEYDLEIRTQMSQQTFAMNPLTDKSATQVSGALDHDPRLS
ncbi:MAG: hypothetical protein Q9183_006172, partial [Haloplaca sp. 2 TL-2023]